MADTLRITVLAGKTFRGVHHFQPQDYDASTELATYAVKSGDAEWSFAKMTAAQLNDWYEHFVGYRPQVDEPRMSEAELRDLILSYVDAADEAMGG
jgi:hypothetical protein